MSSHPWCSSPSRDEAIRGAEDDAAQWRRLEVGEVVQDGDEWLIGEINGVLQWRRCVYGGTMILPNTSTVRRRRVPLPDHRDLPGAVAELRERVGRLEAVAQPRPEPTTGSESVTPTCGLRTERVTLEVTIRDGRQFGPQLDGVCGVVADYIGISRKRGESVRVVADATIGSGDVFRDVGCGSVADEIDRLTAERNAAREECEDLRRKKNHNDRVLWERVDAAESIALTAVEALRKISALDYSRAAVNGAAYEAHCIAKAALEAAPAANAGGEQQEPPRGWLTTEEREKLLRISYSLDYVQFATSADFLRALLARSKPPRGWIHLSEDDCEALFLARAVLDGVFVGSWQEKHDAARRLVGIRERAIREAGGEVK